MFRVEVGGVEREIPDLAMLQQWVDNRLITATTPVWVEAEGTLVEAQTIPGLIIEPHPAPVPDEEEISRQPTAPFTTGLIFAILTMIFCCMPFGVVATIYAIQSEMLARQGKDGEAADSADRARQWAFYALVAGIAIIAMSFLVYYRRSGATGYPRYSQY